MTSDREAAIAGLRALADFLEAHPDLPLPYGTEAGPYITGTDEEERAEVDRIAGILGQPAVLDGGGTHYRAERGFGGGVVYKAVAIAEAEMTAWTEFATAYHEQRRAKPSADRGERYSTPAPPAAERGAR